MKCFVVYRRQIEEYLQGCMLRIWGSQVMFHVHRDHCISLLQYSGGDDYQWDSALGFRPCKRRWNTRMNNQKIGWFRQNFQNAHHIDSVQVLRMNTSFIGVSALLSWDSADKPCIVHNDASKGASQFNLTKASYCMQKSCLPKALADIYLVCATNNMISLVILVLG